MKNEENKVEKSFEERLHSLKVGCIFFGIIEILALVSSIRSFMLGNGSIISLAIEVAMICILYFMYKYTSEMNSKGPTLEYVFGILMFIEGILYCITVVGAIIGIIAIVLSLGILSEAKYFKNYISENGNV